VIPREIGEFVYLTTLELYANEISGIVPTRIGDLQKLKVLKLQINALIGSLPLEIGNCKSLVQLVLYANYLGGKLPDTIGKLEKLEILDVYANNLNELPPKSMAKMKKLGKCRLMLSPNYSWPDKTEPFCFVSLLSLFRTIFLTPLLRIEEVYINHNDMEGAIPKLDANKAKKGDKEQYQNICSLKQLKVLQADCLQAPGFPAEVQCECCTVCCNDNTDPQCVPVKTKATTKR
jgi:Leucine-rich repeat (LRR) protein